MYSFYLPSTSRENKYINIFIYYLTCISPLLHRIYVLLELTLSQFQIMNFHLFKYLFSIVIISIFK